MKLPRLSALSSSRAPTGPQALPGGDGSGRARAIAHPGTQRPAPMTLLAGLVVVGCAVSLSLGVYGRVHTPTGTAITTLGFASLLEMKAWLTTGALGLGVLQVFTGAGMYRHPGRISPRTLALTHHISGGIAVLLTLPVAIQCLWSLGFATYSTRVVLHSVAGCAFYGVFVTKMLALRTRRLPGWAIPVLGGTLFTVLVVLWLSSSLWYFTH